MAEKGVTEKDSVLTFLSCIIQFSSVSNYGGILYYNDVLIQGLIKMGYSFSPSPLTTSYLNVMKTCGKYNSFLYKIIWVFF